MTKLKPCVAALALALLMAAPASAQSGDDDGRQDVTIGNPDRMRSGVNERGDNEMVIESKTKSQQQTPNIGPIYVVPQVNQGTDPAVIPVPAPQAEPKRQPQGQPRPGGMPTRP
ncbi:hypothetical protein [Fundidesulfovibrio terrae]|uniref:hypothetical protein n=1 Tax=Fundidesulfovibrio terrae TaxID=2922866 RepID=UPI001FAF37D3|nr:hypothetical protein [Fundidesulfovibrio terrae]